MIRRINDKIFYGWVMVAASMVIAGTLMGIRFSYGVFFKSLQSEFELTRAATSNVYSAYMVGSAVLGILTGWVSDRYGPKLAACLMGLFTGLSLLVTSQTNAQWQLFLSYSLLLAMGSAAPAPILVSAISRWFDKKRGNATGITASGTALGTFVVAPFTAYLVSNLGWRMSFIVIGLIVWVVVISLALLLRRDPGEIGALPDGAIAGISRIEPTGMGNSRQPAGLSLLQTAATRNFWLLLSIWFMWGICLGLILTHLIPYATDVGIPAIGAATVLSVISGFQIPARVLSGRLSDIIGRKVPGIICGLLGTGAFMWLMWSHNLWMFYLFGALFGLSWGGITVGSYMLTSDSFGGRNLGLIMGLLMVGFSMGTAVGSTFGGIIFDVTDSYSVAFSTGAAAMLITALLFALARNRMNTHPLFT
ncbi:MFS transporter [Chloroflexota bacterium]